MSSPAPTTPFTRSAENAPELAASWALRPSVMLWSALVLASAIGGLVVFKLVQLNALLGLLAAIAVITLQQARSLLVTPLPLVQRELAEILPVGVQRECLLRFRSQCAASLEIEVHDGHPGLFEVEGLPHRFTLDQDREAVLRYLLTPTERGEHAFSDCQVRMHSSLKWLTRKAYLPARQSLKVYPNFAPLAKLALIGAEQASRVVGAHIKRKRGDGTEFQQLREYRAGDTMRQIEWKASQRMGKLISREYQEERNQKLILSLDTGRRMLARDGELSHFDHTLNASLVVAHMALRQGDAVGLQVLGQESRFVAPRRGLGTIDQFLNTVFDVRAECVATDYLKMFDDLSRRQTRRALILLITNIRDEDIEDVLAAVIQLRRKHLVCIASLREDVLEHSQQLHVETVEQALTGAAVAGYLQRRERAHERLRSAGVDILDVNCKELPAALVEHYLRVKRSGRL